MPRGPLLQLCVWLPSDLCPEAALSFLRALASGWKANSILRLNSSPCGGQSSAGTTERVPSGLAGQDWAQWERGTRPGQRGFGAQLPTDLHCGRAQTWHPGLQAAESAGRLSGGPSPHLTQQSSVCRSNTSQSSCFGWKLQRHKEAMAVARDLGQAPGSIWEGRQETQKRLLPFTVAPAFPLTTAGRGHTLGSH